MSTFLGLVLLFATSAYVVYPLFRFKGETRRLPKTTKGAKEELEQRKSIIESALEEAHLDYHTGKLSEADHAELEAQYRKETRKITAQLKQLKVRKKIEDELEEEILTFRKQRRPLVERKILYCPDCGKQVVEADRFCSNCGKKLVP